jgi:hypothetical protein
VTAPTCRSTERPATDVGPEGGATSRASVAGRGGARRAGARGHLRRAGADGRAGGLGSPRRRGDARDGLAQRQRPRAEHRRTRPAARRRRVHRRGGNQAADRLARWNGSAWSAVGDASDQLSGGVFAIAYANGKTYAGGTFTNAGGDDTADKLAVRDGVAGKPFCDPIVPGHPTAGNVKALQVVGSTLYVGGEFQDCAGVGDLDYIVACDLGSGAPRPTLPQGRFLNGVVYALTADSNGVLYAGGGFSNVDDIPRADKVAAFAGGQWSAVGSGPACVCGAITDFVRSLTTIGTDLYVGTDAKDVAGIAQADNVARWNGTAWTAVGSDAAGTGGWFPTSTSSTR